MKGLDFVIEAAVKSRLEEWGREYGGSRYENVGYPSVSTLAKVIDHRGFNPDPQLAKLAMRLDGAADEVERIVLELQRQGLDGFADAHCLRVAYDPNCITLTKRLRVLRAIGRRDQNNKILARICHRRYGERKARAERFVGELLFQRRAAAKSTSVRLVPDKKTLETASLLEAGALKRQVAKVERLLTRHRLSSSLE